MGLAYIHFNTAEFYTKILSSEVRLKGNSM